MNLIDALPWMGNSESQNSEGGNRASGAAPSEMRTCYYEILEVERSDATTSDDIKKVVSKMHPYVCSLGSL